MSLFFIDQGKLKFFRTDQSGNEYITALLGPGDFVGYVALLEESLYTETAEILEDASVICIPKADFLGLIFHQQDVANQFIRLLTGTLVEQQERLLKLAYQSVRKRVAEALLMVQRKFYSLEHGLIGAVADNPYPAMTLSRDNWSHLVGASTETVIRILSDFRAEGLIDINASQITLLDMDKLTHLKH